MRARSGLQLHVPTTATAPAASDLLGSAAAAAAAAADAFGLTRPGSALLGLAHLSTGPFLFNFSLLAWEARTWEMSGMSRG